jgi:hypothetical protein
VHTEPDPVEQLVELAAGSLTGPAPRVVVFADDDAEPVVRSLQRVAPQAQVRVFDPATDPDSLHIELTATGPYDAIIDVVEEPEAARLTRTKAVFFHLRHGGSFVISDVNGDRRRAEAVMAAGGTEEEVAEAIEEGRASAAAASEGEYAAFVSAAFEASLRPKPPRSRGPQDKSAWGRALETVVVRNGNLLIVSGLHARAKIREDQVTSFLARVGPGFGAVLLERPGSVVENPAPIRESEAEGTPRLRTRFEAPPMQLREYRDVGCFPGQMVARHNVLLPETFRHLARKRLGSRFVEDVNPRFGKLKGWVEPEPLEGDYFHLDSEFRGHFGHAMTEQISRLWAWEDAKRRFPDLKALLLVNRTRTEIYDWEYRLYEAAGIAREDLVLADRSVLVPRLVAATPMFSQPEFIHADIVEVYDRIGDALAAEAPQREYPDKIFSSRRNNKRSCHNTADVEQFFADRGFEIVYPEDYPMGEQVQMFRSASEVAGFGGSAMFTTAFVAEPKRVVLVSSANYSAQNEFLIAAVRGHQVNVAWCRPDLPRSEGYKGEVALQSPYTFDPEREGRFLQDVLNG